MSGRRATNLVALRVLGALLLLLAACGEPSTDITAAHGPTTWDASEPSRQDDSATSSEPSDDGICSPSEIAVRPLTQNLEIAADGVGPGAGSPDSVDVRFEIRNSSPFACAWPLEFEILTLDTDGKIVQRVGVLGDCDPSCGEFDPGETTHVGMPWVPITVRSPGESRPPEASRLDGGLTYTVVLSLPSTGGEDGKPLGSFVPQMYAEIRVEVL